MSGDTADQTVDICRVVYNTLREGERLGLHVTKLPDFIRVLGFNPTELELSYVCGELAPDRYLEFFEVLPIVRQLEKKLPGERVSASGLLEGLDRLSNSQGDLSERELRRVLTTLGEPLTDAQVTEVLDGCVDHRGFVDNVSLCGTLLYSAIDSFVVF